MERIASLTIVDIAKAYNITPQRARELARLRGIGQKVGRVWCFTSEDVKALKPGERGHRRKSKGESTLVQNYGVNTVRRKKE